MIYLNKRRLKWLSQEHGSFTVEASMLFPLIMMLLIVVMFFCLYMYQQVMLVYVGSTAAERASYSWDNSYKAAKTGEVQTGQNDSLYWRLNDDQVLDILFGLGSGNTNAAYQVGGGNEGTGDGSAATESLPIKKMAKSAAWIPFGIQGEMKYRNSLIKREVSINLNHPIRFAPLEWIMGRLPLTTQLSSTIVDPVEFIRTVELARYYGAKFQGKGNSGGSGSDNSKLAGEVLANKKKVGK